MNRKHSFLLRFPHFAYITLGLFCFGLFSLIEINSSMFSKKIKVESSAIFEKRTNTHIQIPKIFSEVNSSTETNLHYRTTNLETILPNDPLPNEGELRTHHPLDSLSLYIYINLNVCLMISFAFIILHL